MPTCLANPAYPNAMMSTKHRHLERSCSRKMDHLATGCGERGADLDVLVEVAVMEVMKKIANRKTMNANTSCVCVGASLSDRVSMSTARRQV